VLEKATILGGKSLVEYNRAFLTRHQSSLAHRAAAAEVLFSLAPQQKKEALDLMTTLTNVKGHVAMKV
jgi:peptide alpha-N-acetyltransferase